MKLLDSLLALVCVTTATAVFGAASGFLVGLLCAPMFGGDLTLLPAFAVSGGAAMPLWILIKVFRCDVVAATEVRDMHGDNVWGIGDQTGIGTFDEPDLASAFDSSPLNDGWGTHSQFAQPRCMIDAFQFGDNLHSTVFES